MRMKMFCHTFTLTPPLSLRERENRLPVVLRIGDRRLLKRLEETREHRLLFPLPAGEGQGEGERPNLQPTLKSP